MLIRPLRGMLGEYGSLRRGVVAEVDDTVGERLIKAGRAESVNEAGPMTGEAAETALSRPSAMPSQSEATEGKHRAGSQTGKAKLSSSSPRGQARAKKSKP